MCLVCLRKGLLPFDMCLVCLQKSIGTLFSDPLSSFLSLMKEKKAKENQGDDRLLFFRVLDRWNELVLPFGGMLDRGHKMVMRFCGIRFRGHKIFMHIDLSLFFGR